MKARPKHLIPCALGALIACFAGASYMHGQAAAPTEQKPANTEQKPLMAEDVFKNVQLLRGIPVKEFLDTMGFFSAATGMNCIDCHSPQGADSLDGYAIDTPLKQTARKMMIMVDTLNRSNFGGAKKVTCYTCHRATDHPEAVPSLLDQYSVEPDDPDKIEIPENAAQVPSKITPDQILDKYLQALGGPAALAKFTSLTAKGTYEGFDSVSEKVPIDIYASAPDQLSTVVHLQRGDSVNTFDGTHGWTAQNDKLMRVLPLAEGDLGAAKMDGSVLFPAGLKKDFKWRTGFPAVTINDKPVQIIQDASGGEFGTKLYFDKTSGLLVRQVRFMSTAVGIIPSQVDYSDYRLVGGVKFPYHVVATWTDNQTTVQLTSVQPNVKIDAAKFAMPAPPKAKPETP
jgi:hypothetical protein